MQNIIKCGLVEILNRVINNESNVNMLRSPDKLTHFHQLLGELSYGVGNVMVDKTVPTYGTGDSKNVDYSNKNSDLVSCYGLVKVPLFSINKNSENYQNSLIGELDKILDKTKTKLQIVHCINFIPIENYKVNTATKLVKKEKTKQSQVCFEKSFVSGWINNTVFIDNVYYDVSFSKELDFHATRGVQCRERREIFISIDPESWSTLENNLRFINSIVG